MGPDKIRCWWPGEDPLYVAYHDSEWGVPEYDGRALYEKLVLDGFQAGLSWITILRKRENFRKAFHQFDPQRIARYGTRDLDRLLKNQGIIRSRAKIEAAIKGARLWLEIEERTRRLPRASGSMWRQAAGQSFQERQVPAHRDGETWRPQNARHSFCGPVIVYAFAQATGMIMII